ncbi:MAG: hypothetical protein ACSHX7_00030 [Luteolibacter sp.]
MNSPQNNPESRSKQTVRNVPESSASNNTPSKQASPTNRPIKTSTFPLKEELFGVLLVKAKEVAGELKGVMLESEVSKAAESISKRKTEEFMEAARKYARRSASSCKIKQQELLQEVLVQNGIAPLKKPGPKKGTKPKNKLGKQGGGDAK